LTGGQGSYSIEFARYAAVPAHIQQQLASQFELQEED
jgi:elongation factor G